MCLHCRFVFRLHPTPCVVKISGRNRKEPPLRDRVCQVEVKSVKRTPTQEKKEKRKSRLGTLQQLLLLFTDSLAVSFKHVTDIVFR